MIHQVKIKSLPQEWLWCETWCDDGSKKNAKTFATIRSPKNQSLTPPPELLESGSHTTTRSVRLSLEGKVLKM
ncbi:hypothetical protein CAEBREN_13622 [Caenorhabditis brenneri]|uniref:Glucosyltransferase 24 catalytic domain-containing protein n=1 Tax=Caenorhabditis brenneri TaxID=135651 RepID=G0N1N2_CAEBE|nr:hypothetical protein CAEBREN_13622 [Caenorhabditis brenneri]